MGGFFGVASKQDCVFDLYFGTDYHSHLGTRRAGMAVYNKEDGFDRAIHNIENAPFRTKFDKDVALSKPLVITVMSVKCFKSGITWPTVVDESKK